MEIKPSKYYIRLLKKNKRRLEKQYGISRMGIFGSVARGTHNVESDIDICVEMEPDMLALAGIYADLEHLFGKKVDIVRLSKYTNPLLKKKIENEAIYV